MLKNMKKKKNTFSSIENPCTAPNYNVHAPCYIRATYYIDYCIIDEKKKNRFARGRHKLWYVKKKKTVCSEVVRDTYLIFHLFRSPCVAGKLPLDTPYLIQCIRLHDKQNINHSSITFFHFLFINLKVNVLFVGLFS